MQTNFGHYVRMNEMPEIAVHLVPNRDANDGAGTSAVPPAAPNGCNGLYAPAVRRIRTLPTDLQA